MRWEDYQIDASFGCAENSGFFAEVEAGRGYCAFGGDCGCV
jgi:hypothetical protein